MINTIKIFRFTFCCVTSFTFIKCAWIFWHTLQIIEWVYFCHIKCYDVYELCRVQCIWNRNTHKTLVFLGVLFSLFAEYLYINCNFPNKIHANTSCTYAYACMSVCRTHFQMWHCDRWGKHALVQMTFPFQKHMYLLVVCYVSDTHTHTHTASNKWRRKKPYL